MQGLNLHAMGTLWLSTREHPGIVLGWVTFLALVFWCTLSPIFHPIIEGDLGEPAIFNQWLVLGEIDAG